MILGVLALMVIAGVVWGANRVRQRTTSGWPVQPSAAAPFG
ncbi:MAG: hypothetical protein RI900_1448, partial [Actinomycetota bacterium]